MSLKITPQTINTITNSNDQSIFEFPANTILDKILPDLWTLITNYYYCDKPLAFGNYTTNPEYRLITQEECETKDFKQLFLNCYYHNKGIYCLNDFTAFRTLEDMSSLTHDFYAQIGENTFPICLPINKKDFKKGDLIRFNFTNKIDDLKFVKKTVPRLRTGFLLIKKGIRLY